MKFTTIIEAIQLTEGDTSFEGQEVKNAGPDGFVNVRDAAGSEYKVSTGQWLVKHSNGAFEVRSDVEGLVPIAEEKINEKSIDNKI